MLRLIFVIHGLHEKQRTVIVMGITNLLGERQQEFAMALKCHLLHTQLSHTAWLSLFPI